MATPAEDTSETGPRSVILTSIDAMMGQLGHRLDGLGDAEYLWEPASGMWSVRVDERGVPAVQGAGERDIDPAPPTTIAWRMWHLALDCFDDYTRRLAGDASGATAEWTLDAKEARDALTRCWDGFRAALVERNWRDSLGPLWGPYEHKCVADLAMHASNELVHHGAEIALLRDLYRTTTSLRV